MEKDGQIHYHMIKSDLSCRIKHFVFQEQLEGLVKVASEGDFLIGNLKVGRIWSWRTEEKGTVQLEEIQNHCKRTEMWDKNSSICCLIYLKRS